MEWIRTQDKQPDADGPVYFFVPGMWQPVRTGYAYLATEIFVDDTDSWDFSSVTHWMPRYFPDPPEDALAPPAETATATQASSLADVARAAIHKRPTYGEFVERIEGMTWD